MATKKKAKADRVFALPDGTKYNIVGETGKYILCDGGIQFRKSAKRGEIIELPVAKKSESEKDEEN